MTDREALTISSRAQLRREIEQQIQHYLSDGGTIEVIGNSLQTPRPIGTVWWDTRGNGPMALSS